MAAATDGPQGRLADVPVGPFGNRVGPIDSRITARKLATGGELRLSADSQPIGRME
jgi:hypothetical protein